MIVLQRWTDAWTGARYVEVRLPDGSRQWIKEEEQ